jgi:sirohydrochlorin cobaltochelatase
MNVMILLAHGARRSEWSRPFTAILERLQADKPSVAIRLAFLEFMEPDFATACDELVRTGASRIVVCPLFLGTGGHVERDVPLLIEAAQARWPHLEIERTPTLGEEPQVILAIAAACARHLP